MKKNRNYLTTQEFANLFGITKHTLFHYDDIDLFKPAFVNDKGYRFYDIHQYDTLDTILDLKDAGMKLSEIKDYLNNRSPENILTVYDNQINRINKRIDQLKLIKKNVMIVRDSARSALAHKNQIQIEELHDEFLTFSKTSTNTDDFTYTLLLTDAIHHSNYDKIEYITGTRLLKEDIIRGEINGTQACYTKCLTKEKNSILKEGGTYLCYYHEGTLDSLNLGYSILCNYIKENNIDIGNYFYEETIIGSWASKNPAKYISKLSVRINKK